MKKKASEEYPDINRRFENYQPSELVLGIVCTVGVDYKCCIHVIEEALNNVGITTTVLQMSQIMETLADRFHLGYEKTLPNERARIREKMRLGNELRRVSRYDEIITLAAIAKINQARERVGGGQLPLGNQAHIIATLKRPEEVETLRKIYGPGFYLIGIFDSFAGKLKNLDKHGVKEADARSLMKDDEDDKELAGQLTRATYHQADVFVSLADDEYKEQLRRFIEIIFSNPFRTPTREEFAMSVAHTCGLRSAQQGRQVGAVVVSSTGEIIGTGCNEVPKPNGGQYWEGDVPDQRDHQIKRDSNDAAKADILSELLQRFDIEVEDEVVRKAVNGSAFSKITEFGRAVHAEMEAILACGRSGSSTVGATLYTTTFPCHNCVRHIVGAGIARVVYIEPYPKSSAFDLHSDAIAPEGSENYASSTASSDIKLPLQAFVGVAPRRYDECFSLKPAYGEELKRKIGTTIVMWGEENAKPRLRVPMHPVSYLQREQLAVRSLQSIRVTPRREDEATETNRRTNGARGVRKRPRGDSKGRPRMARLDEAGS
jgi:deoxycytidylate deaminase